MPIGKSNKMLQFVNWKMKVTLSDSRALVGTFMAFDKHMNIVLADCDEFRKIRVKKGKKVGELKRKLGLVLLRGATVVSMTPVAKPEPKSRSQIAAERKSGPGLGVPLGRGMVPTLSAPPTGLTGPVMGMGGPNQRMMQPQGMVAPPQGRGGPPPSFGMPPMPPMRGYAPPPMMRGPPQPPMMMGRGRGMAPPQFGRGPFPPPPMGQGPPPPMRGPPPPRPPQ